ncbi:hypothetical protein E1H12_18925 [Geitlerinema sp. P-1104]|uniref:hypothetical protein n=1 Tax=Geitlerinema sp. P-1104 TaxID=2546230 RepID=UPI0014772E0C|nr:hypothetical protein [Geitlerinema sp. P-1104]NMG60531.1 hypothetical protein [Geitlerinema sp. P-1104]
MRPQNDKSRQPKTPRDVDKTDRDYILELAESGIKSMFKVGESLLNLFNPESSQKKDDRSNQKNYQNPSKDSDYNYSRDSKQSSGSSNSINRQPIYVQQRITAELCLIVPARLVSNLTPPQTLTREQICELIDNCAYFRCLPSKDLGSLEQDLQPTSEPILHDSERDVYIRIQIKDGENMIHNSSCYGLKKRLPQTGTCELQERLLLANLSGRQHFNRI